MGQWLEINRYQLEVELQDGVCPIWLCIVLPLLLRPFRSHEEEGNAIMKAINLYASACKRGCHEAYYFMHGVVRQVLETLDSGVVVCEPEGFALDEAQSNACFEECLEIDASIFFCQRFRS
eukprot:g13011.t1